MGQDQCPEDNLGIKTFNFSISVEFIEVADMEDYIRISEEFYNLDFFQPQNKVSTSCLKFLVATILQIYVQFWWDVLHMQSH